ncbi:MAG: hypothetical protein WC378_15770 [Opitutaceae bacterium]
MPLLFLPSLAALAFLTGCSTAPSTARRAGAVALGASVAGLAAHEVSGGNAAATGLGAAGGALLTHLALGQDRSVMQAGFDQGYLQGQSDAIKRQYFLRQEMERKPLTAPREGETVIYSIPLPATAEDGSKRAPASVAVRVVE